LHRLQDGGCASVRKLLLGFPPLVPDMVTVVQVENALSGRLHCTCALDMPCSVSALKDEIERLEGTPRLCQRLLLQGKLLCDGDALEKSRAPVRVSLVRLDPRRIEAQRGLANGTLELDELEEDLRHDREVVLAAVRADGHALQHVPAPLRSDREVVLAALCEDALALRHAPEEMQEDLELVRSAVQRNGTALAYAHASLRREPELVLAAMGERGVALQRSPEELRGALRRVLDLAGELMDDRNFALSAVGLVPAALEFVSPRLRGDGELVLEAVKLCPKIMCFAAPALQEDRRFVLAAVRANAHAIEFAAERLKDDAEIAGIARQHSREAHARIAGLLHNW